MLRPGVGGGVEIVYSCKTEKVGWGEGDRLQLKNGKSGWGTYTLYI